MGGSKRQVIGYKYFLGMHIIVCHMVDAVTAIIVGDRTAWSGNVTTNTRINISAPELFGGDKKEGGISGPVDIEMGGPTQGANSYLVSKLGSLMPGFRGVLGLVLNQVYVAAMNPYPKPWAVRVKYIPAKTLLGSNAEVNGSANGAGIIYEAITNGDWGMGYSDAVIDTASFQAAAATLKTEGLGLSMLLVKESSVEQFIGQVLNHINGILYTNRTTGKFVLKLLRDDYNLATLPVYDTTNITKLEVFERPAYNELPNEITVVYRPKGSTKDESVTVQHLAAIQAQNGTVTETINYPGIDTVINANKIAIRDIRARATPLARAKFKVNRAAWNQNLGDVIKFSWPDYDIDELPMRILKMSLGTLTDREITIDCVEDVFAFPTISYIGNQDSGWTDPNQPPTEFDGRQLIECPYWDLHVNQVAEDIEAIAPTDCYGKYLVPPQMIYFSAAEVYEQQTPYGFKKVMSGGVTPTATLTADVAPLTTSLNTSGFPAIAEVRIGSYIHLGNEICRVDNYDPSTGVLVVGRGCLDTVPTRHLSGTLICLAEDYQIYIPTLYLTSETQQCRLRMRNGVGLMPLDTTPSDYLLMQGRANRPYPPGQFKINGLAYTLANQPYNNIVVSWVHRNRLTQVGLPMTTTIDGSITPEAGTTYIVRLYDGAALLFTQEVSGTSASFALPIEYALSLKVITVKLKSRRDGLDSWQEHVWDIIVQ